MSRIRTNLITNRMANGAPTVSHGLVISGVTTVTGSINNLNLTGITTISTLDLNGDLDVDGHLNVDNLSVAGVTTFSGNIGGTATFQDIDVDGHTNLDNVNIAGFTTFAQDINVTGSVTGTSLVLNAGAPTIFLNDTDANSDFSIQCNGGLLKFMDTTNSYATRLSINSSGNVSIAKDLDVDGHTNLDNVSIAGVITATSFSGSGANLTSLRTNRNLIINGDCSVCQYRGITGETTGVGVLTTDRWHLGYSGHDEEITQEHRNNPVSAAPSKLGISHSFQVKNGNQTSTGSNDYCRISYTIESQYMRNSGWDFQNSNSFLTLSFWVKSSVSKNFYGQFFCQDSPFLQRSFETGTLSANTWTKVEISIPGYSTMNFDHNEGPGLIIYWYLYAPTAYTSGNGPLNTWMGYNSTKFTPTDSDAWWTTDNATFDITGVQLEVGSTATPFELKSYDQNLWECKRYYQRSTDQNRGSNYSLETSTWHSADGVQSFNKHNAYYDFKQNFEREMRVPPTLTIYGSSNQGDIHLESVAIGSKQVDWNNNTTEVQSKGFLLRHIEDQSDGNYTSGSGNAFGILAYTLDAEF